MSLRALALVLLSAASAAAQGPVAGRFDYYILALSWSPAWCRSEGDARDAPQCDAGRRTGFTIHGLWPQYERGWPQDCASGMRGPSRRDSAAMADVMGSGGLAWHQWRKHGRCSGLAGAEYYAAIRRAGQAVGIPAAFEGSSPAHRLPVAAVEDAFIGANPDLTRDGITVTCEGGALREVRICLTRGLRPRDCAPDARRDCRAPTLLIEQVR